MAKAVRNVSVAGITGFATALLLDWSRTGTLSLSGALPVGVSLAAVAAFYEWYRRRRSDVLP